MLPPKGPLPEQRREDLPLRCGRERPAERLEIPGELVRVLALAVAGVAARAGKVLDDLHPRHRALSSPARGLAVGTDAGEDPREAVAPRIDGLEVNREDIARFAAFDVDRADDRVVLGRPRRVQRIDMGVAHELVHLRVVAVVLDEARERVVRLDPERLFLLDVKHRLVSRIECVLGYLAALDDLHGSTPQVRWMGGWSSGRNAACSGRAEPYDTSAAREFTPHAPHTHRERLRGAGRPAGRKRSGGRRLAGRSIRARRR